MSEPDLFAPIPAPAAAAQGFALCTFDGLTLAIPQTDIASIEHGGELAAPLSGERVFGWFAGAQGPWPVYAFDRALRRCEFDYATPRGSFIVFLKRSDIPLGILCESVQVVGRRTDLNIQALPEPLRGYSPADTGLALLPDGRIALCFASGTLAPALGELDASNGREVLADSTFGPVDTTPTDQPASVRAWLLEWPTQPLALALCEVVELVDAPRVQELPFGPSWCRSVLYWRQSFLPLATGESQPDALVVVTAFQEASGQALQYAAFALRSPPRQITVVDGLDCEPPASQFAPAQLRASFRFDDHAVIVPELARLFGSPS